MTEPSVKTAVFEGEGTIRRLSELSLDLDKLMLVLAQGESARAQATGHDPVNAGGLDAYRYRVRGLRDNFCPLGWGVGRDGGLESIVSPCGKRQVITRAGDEDVGVYGGCPAPKRPVGESTGRAVAANSALLFDASYLNAPNVERPHFETWMLLVFRTNDVFRAELSLPSEVPESDTRPLAWFERILLPDLDLNDPFFGRENDADAGHTVVDVPVIRKR